MIQEQCGTNARYSDLEWMLLKQHADRRLETISSYAPFVRRIDTKGLLLRKLIFHGLRILSMGTYHYITAAKG